MKKYFILIGLLTFFANFSFGQIEKTNSVKQEEILKLTKIQFDEPTFEFGEIREGEKIKNVFSFTNKGTEPLVITKAKGSCGCTVPMWPKEPILPGESAELLVEFDSKGKGHVDGSLQSKRVTITANTDPATTYLTIRGTVFKDKEINKNVSKRKVELDIETNKVLIYPNPAQAEISVDIKALAGNKGKLEIYDSTGRKLSTRQVDGFGEVLTFDISDYPTGIYTVSIKVDGMNRLAKRFLVGEK